MDWPTLMSATRYTGHSTVAGPTGRPMTAYQLDTERIIYTSVFRRLQGKTQVYPLPIYDYLRTRLTHTNEVAFVGKVIARNIAKKIPPAELCGVPPEDISDVVYAACLAHDLGNPPFGHIGEEAIQTWFSRRIKTEPFKNVLSDAAHKNDFLFFDGNAQGFRILTAPRYFTWVACPARRLR